MLPSFAALQVNTRSAAHAPAPAPVEPTLAELGIHDIDMVDAHDPHCVTDYVQDIYKHFRATEVRACPLDTSRRRQPLVSSLTDHSLE